ncbi:hypothetical protein [Streptomyces sp. NPDC059262]|uniref:hypothetical protein n=1 Tax=Streptomyces sp. NPDC059262 TaxID=3346797 RepID=UPI0036C19A44
MHDDVRAEGAVQPVVGDRDRRVEELDSGAGQFGHREDGSEVLGGERRFVGVGQVESGQQSAVGRAPTCSAAGWSARADEARLERQIERHRDERNAERHER